MLFAFGATIFGGGDVPTLFFSRRIGLESGQTVPILGGGRLTGKVGKFSIGAVNIQTDDAPSVGALSTNFTVLRVKRDILRRSRIGGIFTGRSVSTVGAGSNEVYGLDALFSFYDNVNFNGYYARTRTPGLDGDDARSPSAAPRPRRSPAPTAPPADGRRPARPWRWRSAAPRPPPGRPSPTPCHGPSDTAQGRYGIGRDQGVQVTAYPSPEALGLCGQAPALGGGDPETARTALLSEDAMLFLERVNDVTRLLVDPARDGHDEELQHVGKRRHTGRAEQRLSAVTNVATRRASSVESARRTASIGFLDSTASTCPRDRIDLVSMKWPTTFNRRSRSSGLRVPRALCESPKARCSRGSQVSF